MCNTEDLQSNMQLQGEDVILPSPIPCILTGDHNCLGSNPDSTTEELLISSKLLAFQEPQLFQRQTGDDKIPTSWSYEDYMKCAQST